MAELRPYPFAALVRRMFAELSRQSAIFDLPRRRFVTQPERLDYSVCFHGRRAATPFGPAAGPHSQLAQNIVLAWLVGGRIFELKTVQILDALEIPRPCIDMQTVGFNVEWSQELKLQQSFEEYVKASMLIEIAIASSELGIDAAFGESIFDMSVGYDLKGIQSEPVQAFIRGMRDASAMVDRLRTEIPEECRRYRDVDFKTRISDTLTLSTFHGCPPEEIEGIIDFLLRDLGLNCVIKLNPTLLGKQRLRALLNDEMGYAELEVPDEAFERDTTWEQAVGIVERLKKTADARGLSLGVKFTNTLIVRNHRDFFPGSEKEMYLSGAPLHVLAINLVEMFRRHFGDELPISFSAGIDSRNFVDAVAIGLTPITVCSDLLKPGGYGRAQSYFNALKRAMEEAGAASVGDLILRAHDGVARATLESLAASEERRRSCQAALVRPGADLMAAAGEDLYGRWVSAARLQNTERYAAAATADRRYRKAANQKLPKKVGSQLELFDCISCDKCIPVCPNDANFTFVIPRAEIPIFRLEAAGEGYRLVNKGALRIDKKHQIGNVADLCNECGNCDIFCPEDGGPYLRKPRFFGSRADFDTFSSLDGFFVEPGAKQAAFTAHGRIDGETFSLLRRDDGQVRFSGAGFSLSFIDGELEGTLAGIESNGAPIDLAPYEILARVVHAVLDPASINYVNILASIE